MRRLVVVAILAMAVGLGGGSASASTGNLDATCSFAGAGLYVQNDSWQLEAPNVTCTGQAHRTALAQTGAHLYAQGGSVCPTGYGSGYFTLVGPDGSTEAAGPLSIDFALGAAFFSGTFGGGGQWWDAGGTVVGGLTSSSAITGCYGVAQLQGNITLAG